MPPRQPPSGGFRFVRSPTSSSDAGCQKQAGTAYQRQTSPRDRERRAARRFWLPASSFAGHEPALADLIGMGELLNEDHLTAQRLHELGVETDELERIVSQLH